MHLRHQAQEHAKCDVDIPMQEHAKCDVDIQVQKHAKYTMDIPVEECPKFNSDILVHVQECAKWYQDGLYASIVSLLLLYVHNYI